jgi:predicted RND superfamily exporter protein
MNENVKKYKTVNIALGISDEREHEICKKLDKMANKTETKQIATLIQGIEEWDSFSRIEKSYAIFLFGEAVGRKRYDV